MDLAPDTLRGLELLRDPKKVPDATYAKLLELALDVLLGRRSEAELAGVPELGLDPLVMKQAWASVSALFVAFAKLDLSAAQMKDFFAGQSFPESRAEAFVTAAGRRAALTAVRAQLGAASFHFPHVIDVQWRLDYQLRSDAIERINAPLYAVTLVLADTSRVAFTCSQEEMQELVARLKDATQALDRVDLF